jgi:curli biogenesis system outer membrane secretion channel CsgG
MNKMLTGAKLQLLMVLAFLLISIMPGYVHAEKMRIGFAEEIDSTVDVPDFIKANLRDSVRQNLIDSGKFEVVERNQKDIKRLLDEMYSSSERVGRVDIADDKKAEFGRIAGIEYMVLITINDFFSGVEQSKFEKVKTADKPAVRVGANLRLVNTSTAKIKLEKSVSAKKSSNSRIQGGGADREASNKAIEALSGKIIKNIIDELYPILILDRSGSSAFINRGKDSGIKMNDTLEVFAVKKVLDEGTQEDVELAYPVGKIKITSLSDKTAQAEIMEDFGITKGCIAKVPDSDESSSIKEIRKDMNKKTSDEDW